MLNRSKGPKFIPIPWSEVDWDKLDRFADRHVFQTKAWVEFLAEVQDAQPVIAALQDGRETLGYFTGLTTRRCGLDFLGSPLPGWTTPYMGFNLKPGVSRRVAVAALTEFAIKELRCAHFELRDRHLTERDVAGLGFGRRSDVGFDERTFEIDLSLSEDELFSRMTSACRRCIRKADKTGVVIEEATDLEFADEFYDQLREVFLRQGLVPTYSIERVRALIRHLLPTGMLLLLRARDPEGRCIATGIYPAFGEIALFWGGASYREYQHYRPNEALHWYAMRYWKARGIARYDLGGYMDYKRKYGGEEISIPAFRQSRHAWVSIARTLAPAGMRLKQTIIGQATRNFGPTSRRLAGAAILLDYVHV